MRARLLVLVGLAFGVVPFACGGSFAGIPAEIDGGAASDAASAADVQTSNDASSGADANPGVEAAADTAAPNGGVIGTAGKISCGAANCNAASQFCCDRGGGSATCNALAQQCTIGWELHCDDTSDCEAGRLCCLEPTLNAARCLPTCVTGLPRHQLCKIDAECQQPGQTCQAYTCPGGHAVQACEQPFGCK